MMVRPHRAEITPRKLMSLIIALPCHDGVVICADSRESAGQYKASVNKIEMRRLGPYEIVFGGAGNDSNLIDGLDDAIRRAFTEAKDVSVVPEIRIRRTVSAFYKHEVALHT